MPIPRLPSRVGSMPAASQYFFTSRQGVLRSRCLPPDDACPVRAHRAKERPLLVIPNAPPLEVSSHRPGGVEQDFAPLLIALLGDVQVVLNAVRLEVPDAGPDHRRNPA